jgi:hypothetical protein
MAKEKSLWIYNVFVFSMMLIHFQNPERCPLGNKMFLEGLASPAIAIANCLLKLLPLDNDA